MSGLTIIAYGRPITQGSKVRTKFAMRDANSETLKPWRDNVRTSALAAIEGKDYGASLGHTDPFARMDGPVVVRVTFVFDRPKGHYRTGKNAHLLRDDAPAYPSNVKSGDIDKLQRSCFDALTDAGIWKDDCQVVAVKAFKVYVTTDDAPLDRPGVEIWLTPYIAEAAA